MWSASWYLKNSKYIKLCRWVFEEIRLGQINSEISWKKKKNLKWNSRNDIGDLPRGLECPISLLEFGLRCLLPSFRWMFVFLLKIFSLNVLLGFVFALFVTPLSISYIHTHIYRMLRVEDTFASELSFITDYVITLESLNFLSSLIMSFESFGFRFAILSKNRIRLACGDKREYLQYGLLPTNENVTP